MTDPRNTNRWKKVRVIVLERDNYTCYYCNREANTVDHLIALANGGDPFDVSNLVACCAECNSTKQDKIGVRLAWHNPRYP